MEIEKNSYGPIDWDKLKPGDIIYAFEHGDEQPFAAYEVDKKFLSAANLRVTNAMRSVGDTGFRSYDTLTKGSKYKKIYGDEGLVVYRMREDAE